MTDLVRLGDDLERAARRQLAGVQGRRRRLLAGSVRGRWPQLAAATAIVAVAVFAALSLLDSDDGSTPGVVARAVAALSEPDAIYHTEFTMRASDMPNLPPLVHETWHTAGGRVHERTYAAEDGGKGRLEAELAGRPGLGGATGPGLIYEARTNEISESGLGYKPNPQWAPQINPFDPAGSLRELQAAGRLSIAGRELVDGKPGYRLVSDDVRNPGGVQRTEILVDADTYLPLEQRLFVRVPDGPSTTIVWHYLTYEKLPLNDETRPLLDFDPPPGAKCAPRPDHPVVEGQLGFPNPCAP